MAVQPHGSAAYWSQRRQYRSYNVSRTIDPMDGSLTVGKEFCPVSEQLTVVEPDTFTIGARPSKASTHQ